MGDNGNGRKRICGSSHCQGFSSYSKKICSIFICGSTGSVPKRTVKGVAVLSTVIGVFEAVLGLWLAIITFCNGALPIKNQIYFRQIRGPTSIGDFFVNESPFMMTLLNNLSFYLYSMATIAFLAGIGRIIMSIFLFIYIRKNSASNSVFYGWAVITVLSLGSLFVISFDTLKTLGMSFDVTQEVAPPHIQDFQFTNDVFGFYYLCHVYKWGIITDIILTLYCLCVVRMYFYDPTFRSTSISTSHI